MASLQQQNAFLQQYAPLANTVAQQTGNSPAEILGQWALETGWGTESGMGSYNPGNIQSNGQNVNFSSPSAFAQEYVNTLTTLGATNDANNVGAFAAANAGYDPGNSNYSSSLADTIGTVQGLNSAGSTPGVCILDMGGYGTCGSSSTSPGNASQIGTGTRAGATTGTGNGSAGCSFSITDPVAWFQCEAFNLLFIAVGFLIILAVIWQQIGGGKSFPVPIIPE